MDVRIGTTDQKGGDLARCCMRCYIKQRNQTRRHRLPPKSAPEGFEPPTNRVAPWVSVAFVRSRFA